MLIEGLVIGAIALLAMASGKSGGTAPSDTANGYAMTITPNNNIVLAAQRAVDQEVSGANCFDFVHKVYTMAGHPDVAALDFVWIGNQYADTYKRRTISSQNFLDASQLSMLQPGDWLYIHNENQYDSKGNHSVVFLGWADENNYLANTAEQPYANTPGMLNQRDLVKHPVAHIMRVKS